MYLYSLVPKHEPIRLNTTCYVLLITDVPFKNGAPFVVRRLFYVILVLTHFSKCEAPVQCIVFDSFLVYK
jgi:hypothetical protein